MQYNKRAFLFDELKEGETMLQEEKMFNCHNLSDKDDVYLYFKPFVEEYPKEDLSPREKCFVYIEEYWNKEGYLCARLRDKETNKKITFWVSKNDEKAMVQKNGLLKFLSDAKIMGNDQLFQKDAASCILIQGIFGKETEEEIEVISYLSEFFYASYEKEAFNPNDEADSEYIETLLKSLEKDIDYIEKKHHVTLVGDRSHFDNARKELKGLTKAQLLFIMSEWRRGLFTRYND